VAQPLIQVETLRLRLLALVDEDAEAFRAFLDDKRSQSAIQRVSQAPLRVAGACAELLDLGRQVEERTTGPMLGDVLAARHLAGAALAAALDIVEQDVGLFKDAESQRQLREAI